MKFIHNVDLVGGGTHNPATAKSTLSGLSIKVMCVNSINKNFGQYEGSAPTN